MARVEFTIEASQLRDAAGEFASYADFQLAEDVTFLAESVAMAMQLIAREEIPSQRVADSLVREVFVSPRETRISVFPGGKEFQDLALLLAEGAVPHVIEPVNAGALLWFGAAKPGDHPGGVPYARVIHPGFTGDNYVGRIEERTGDEALVKESQKFLAKAELTLAPKGATSRGLSRRATAIQGLITTFGKGRVLRSLAGFQGFG